MPVNSLSGRRHNRARARIVTAQQDSIQWTANTFRVTPQPFEFARCRSDLSPSLSIASSTMKSIYGAEAVIENGRIERRLATTLRGFAASGLELMLGFMARLKMALRLARKS